MNTSQASTRLVSPDIFRRLVIASLILPAICVPVSAQTAAPPAPVDLTAAQDHQRLLDALHITELRPGVSHDTTATNPVNYDEAKANPYTSLPNPLILANCRSTEIVAAGRLSNRKLGNHKLRYS